MRPPSDPPVTQPIGLTVYTLPAADQAAAAAARAGSRWKMLLVLLVCAAPVVASYFTFYVIRPSGAAAAYSALIQPPVAMPALNGQALDGRTVALRSLRGQWLLVVVDGGACPTDCERRLFMQRQLREMTGRERDRIDKLWLVIDDQVPSAALRAALAATPAMQVLRLPRSAVARWLQPAPGQRLEDHLYIVDPLGDWMMRAPADADPSRLKRDIDRLLRASAGWDQPGRQALRDDVASGATPAAVAPAAGASAAAVPTDAAASAAALPGY